MVFKQFSVFRSHSFIVLSKEDIFGHTIIESLANGTPVVASNKILAANQIIKNGINGYIVNLDKNNEILDSLSKVLSINRNSIIPSVQSFTVENTALDIIKALENE